MSVKLPNLTRVDVAGQGTDVVESPRIVAERPVLPGRRRRTIVATTEKNQNSCSRDDRSIVLMGFNDGALSLPEMRQSLDVTRELGWLLGARFLLGTLGVCPRSTAT